MWSKLLMKKTLLNPGSLPLKNLYRIFYGNSIILEFRIHNFDFEGFLWYFLKVYLLKYNIDLSGKRSA